METEFDNDLYPTLSPEDKATYMSKFDDSFYDEAEARAEFDSYEQADNLYRMIEEGFDAIEQEGCEDWRDEPDCDDWYAEDAFLDSFYEEQFECENDYGCDW